MPNVRDCLPTTGSKPKPIEIAELSAHLRIAIAAMNQRELEAFTDALAASLLSCNDIAVMARNLNNVKPFETMRGKRDV